MANNILIRLSVHPCVRKYLLHHYAEPFFVTELGFAPTLLASYLQHSPKVRPQDFVKKDKINYGEFVGISVGESTFKKRGGFISSEHVVAFNKAMMSLIQEEMYRLITQLKKAGYQVDDTIREFQRMYDFSEDELPFENLKRWYYRERKRLEIRAQERREVQPQFVLNFFEEVKENHPAIASAIFNNQISLNLLTA